MQRTLITMGFFAAFTVVHLLVHYYLWRRLARAPQWTGRSRRLVRALLVTFFVLLPASMIAARWLPREQVGPLSLLGYWWMGYAFYLLLVLAVVDLARLPAALGRRLSRRTPPAPAPDPERRRFLARAVAGGAVVGAGFATLGGVYTARGDFHMPEVPVRLPRLPPALDGYRIVQISDLHIGPTLGPGWLEEVVERVNRLKPDLVALTGDLMDGPVAMLGRDMSALGRLQARDGVYFVTGNHEYYSGVEQWLPHLQRLGLQVLGNRHIQVGDRGPGGASFDLAGIYDRTAGRFRPDHAPDVARAVAGRDPERALVLLAHQPSQVALTAGHGVGLQLSGHTHGGQMWPFGYVVGLQHPFVTGLHAEGETQVYVNQGTGYWGPPMRIGVPPEITTVVLTT